MWHVKIQSVPLAPCPRRVPTSAADLGTWRVLASTEGGGGGEWVPGASATPEPCLCVPLWLLGMGSGGSGCVAKLDFNKGEAVALHLSVAFLEILHLCHLCGLPHVGSLVSSASRYLPSFSLDSATWLGHTLSWAQPPVSFLIPSLSSPSPSSQTLRPAPAYYCPLLRRLRTRLSCSFQGHPASAPGPATVLLLGDRCR